MALLFEQESYNIRGAVFEVHKNMGTGFLEKVYQESLEKEFLLRGIPYEREKRIFLNYKGDRLKQSYIADFICYDKIIVECKAVAELLDIHKIQLLNYLTATNLRLGFLINFSEIFIRPIRVINNAWDPDWVRGNT